MTVPMYEGMVEVWKISPPPGELLKMIAGYKYEAPLGIDDFVAAFPGGTVNVGTR